MFVSLCLPVMDGLICVCGGCVCVCGGWGVCVCVWGCGGWCLCVWGHGVCIFECGVRVYVEEKKLYISTPKDQEHATMSVSTASSCLFNYLAENKLRISTFLLKNL